MRMATWVPSAHMLSTPRGPGRMTRMTNCRANCLSVNSLTSRPAACKCHGNFGVYFGHLPNCTAGTHSSGAPSSPVNNWQS